MEFRKVHYLAFLATHIAYAINNSIGIYFGT